MKAASRHSARSGRIATPAFLIYLATIPAAVLGHGYMFEPETRNYVAKIEGREGTTEGGPRAEYCAHCLNRNRFLCGVSEGGADYDAWLDSTGQTPMPWQSRVTYEQGSTITVRSTLTAHHGGHMEMKACPMGRGSTQQCMDAHVLEFVSDNAYGMPKDPNYPERGYYSGGAGWGGHDFDMTFKLPDDLVGEQVLLQWRYITANSCSPPGYPEYFAANPDIPSSFWSPSVSTCPTPLPWDGDTSKGPEQFFNCAEVAVVADIGSLNPNPSPTLQPIETPTMAPVTRQTEAPVTQLPVPLPTEAPVAVGEPGAQCQNCVYGSSGPCKKSDGACFEYMDDATETCWPGTTKCTLSDAVPTKAPVDGGPYDPALPPCKACLNGSSGPCQTDIGVCFPYQVEATQTCFAGTSRCNPTGGRYLRSRAKTGSMI